MKINDFINQSANKNIFIIECNSCVIANAYESALLQELENKFHIKQKRLYPEEKTSNDILDNINSSDLFYRFVVLVNSENFPLDKIKNSLNFFILRCNQFKKNITGRSDILHIKIKKNYSIINDLIDYYAKKVGLKIEFRARSIVASYIFNNDFSIQSEIAKLQLFFAEKTNLSAKDIDDYFDLGITNIYSLHRDMILCHYKSFLQKVEAIAECTNKIIYSIKIQLKTLNILFNNLCLLEKKQSELAKQKMLSELTNKSFYDAQNLEDAINKKIKKHQLVHAIKNLLELEVRFKRSALCREKLFKAEMIKIFFIFRTY